MEPRIEQISSINLVGFSGSMSLAVDGTPGLWRRLMPRRHEIENRVSTDYVSMRIYREAGLATAALFAPTTVFEKWAAVEVADHGSVPEGMDRHTLAGGMYAVFEHSGPAANFPQTMRFIFGDWLPSSPYELDDREHFEILPENWSTLGDDAREEVWVPIRPTTTDRR